MICFGSFWCFCFCVRCGLIRSRLIHVLSGCVKLSQYCFQELFYERMIDKDMGMGVDVVDKSENNNQNGVAWCCIGQAVVFGYGG
ncbi:hypothetical protein Ddye_011215 [Dipteronia dyeriana]|uniref:Uncharacterized protein n=1 Tax=Dipteronia dyeriana TaxID=168575 RepID=A0AAD9X176_9ROSI|nr:hypothetical protein Ddye_011215 [Dipteronia dyeriana]